MGEVYEGVSQGRGGVGEGAKPSSEVGDLEECSIMGDAPGKAL